MHPVIQIRDIWKEYKLDDDLVFQALKGISLEVHPGELCSIIGPSGCGKSTLMHIIGLLDKPTRGEIYVSGKDTARVGDDRLSSLRNRFIGFVFQQFNLINKLTILENVLLPTMYARHTLDYDPKERATYLLDRFGIGSKSTSYPNKVSGGQQQRVAIARALIMKPELILADEPTGNLDTKTGREIMNLFQELNSKEKITIVIVTHDSEVADKTKRKIKIRDGELEK